MKNLKLTEDWDKVFPKSDKVNHKKVTFKNHFGITLVADMYSPKNATNKLPAIAVSGPFGAVKEQSSGLYAQEMAKRGFLSLAFDPSFTGESGGETRRMNSPDLNVEDFQAAIDYLSNLEAVDADKISIIGICGWGGMAIQTACIDTRVKATVAVTMYDLARVSAKGYFDKEDTEEKRYQTRKMISEQRTIDYKTGIYKMAGGVPDICPNDAPDFVKQYWDYYKTPRGYHKRSGNSTTGWTVNTLTSLLNIKMFDYADEIRSAVLVIHGEKAHSRYMGEDVFKLLKGDNKELLIVPNATHCDLYDGGDNNYIPFDKIESFIRENI